MAQHMSIFRAEERLEALRDEKLRLDSKLKEKKLLPHMKNYLELQKRKITSEIESLSLIIGVSA